MDENENRQESDVKSRIPEGAEATNVLVGTLDELEQPVLAFVRLAKGCHLEQMTEVSIPVRFLFILLGPNDNGELYHQMGRSIATLMSDQVTMLFIVLKVLTYSNSLYQYIVALYGKSSEFSAQKCETEPWIFVPIK